ncbi:uroporphyrinogen III synthase [Flavobacterium akiainvivens]|uniref:Uroporphyrinogen III synthase n=1 Tax=Flavobacterium akiainvivens TaxID=1202724 RepID=A0A0M8MIY7_9FLAO|nr:uroporphyrinogen-III synthase [Flavobacterium akiainvivens]KOS07161.1 uroporphyrinogen III synthase [Flavobacterium akiainvivens]SFQ73082.1 uroporphyrinogen-III synthase [Flavobacterium akiainvivens]
MKRILSTKKLLPNQRLYLLNGGLSVVDANFIGIQHKAFDINTVKANLIFTSRNGVEAFLANPLSVTYIGSNVFCVGPNTRLFLERSGFNVIECKDDAAQLAEAIVTGYPGESFTFFSGNLRRNDLPLVLTHAGIDFNEIQVYETALTPHTITAKPDGIMFFSPSAVVSYLRGNMITDESCFCIGATTAQALKGVTDNIILANKPSVENVIVQVRGYYKEDKY